MAPRAERANRIAFRRLDLITSAPMSPRIWVASGPNSALVKSITRIPESGADISWRILWFDGAGLTRR
jgi:hypothetical protein